jgi:hypothetical protein
MTTDIRLKAREVVPLRPSYAGADTGRGTGTMKTFTVNFYADGADAVLRLTIAGEENTRQQIERVLRSKTQGCFTATSWGTEDGSFQNFYLSELGILFSSSDPLILTRRQALALRSRPSEKTAVKVESAAWIDRRRTVRRKHV